jgi:glycerophosphoryl diester phosphodiesterase
MPFIDRSTPLLIAHRGASNIAPENTLAAFRKAKEIGAEWVEFDVMLSSDGVAVVFHDDTLERTSNGSGELCELPFSYLSQLDAGSWFAPEFAGEKIPTFKDVIEVLKQTGLRANVEIKVPDDLAPARELLLVETVLKEISDYWGAMPAPLISSFSMPALQHVRKLDPHANIGVLIHAWFDGWETIAEELQAVSINLNDEIVTQDKAQHIQLLGKSIICYTVDDPRRAQELFALGVNGIFTNDFAVMDHMKKDFKITFYNPSP